MRSGVLAEERRVYIGLLVPNYQIIAVRAFVRLTTAP